MLEGISTAFDKNSKCDALDCIQSLIAAQRPFTCMEALGVNPKVKRQLMMPLPICSEDSSQRRRGCGKRQCGLIQVILPMILPPLRES